MVVNDRYRFVFIHVPKSAGTSMMRTLQRIPGDNARWVAGTKHETLAQFHSRWRSRRSAADRLLLRSPVRYKTFGFVRNPWDRLASCYKFLKEKKQKKPGVSSLASFEDFLLQAADRVAWIDKLYTMRPQVEYFAARDGSVAADFVGHFEHLHDDMRLAAQVIGVDISLPHENRSSHAGSDYRRDYNARMIEIVCDRFARDIELFGYAFDDRYPTRRCSGPLECRVGTGRRCGT